MSRLTPTSPGSFDGFAQVLILRPARSRLLLGYWWVLHGLAAAGVVSLSSPPALELAILAGLALHFLCRWPPRPPTLVVHPNGRWAAPTLGLTELRPARSCRYGGWWIRLTLEGGPVRLQVWLLRDQLEPSLWRRLQARLGRQPTESP